MCAGKHRPMSDSAVLGAAGLATRQHVILECPHIQVIGWREVEDQGSPAGQLPADTFRREMARRGVL